MELENIFIRIFIATVSSLLLAISAFNYFVDPLNIFNRSTRESSEVKLARLLSIHRNIISTNMDERVFIRARIDLEPVEFNPSTIVVGSSRVMQIGNHIFDHNVFNLGVSGVSVEDLVAILGIATKKYKPKLLMIGVDPWIFNDASGQLRWKSLSNEYKEGMAELGFDPLVNTSDHKKIYKELVGAAYTKESIKYFYNNFIHPRNENLDFIDSDSPQNDKDIIRKDGSRVYNVKYANQSQDSIIRESKSWFDYSMSSYRFSNKRLKIFEVLLRMYAKNYHVVLIIYFNYIIN